MSDTVHTGISENSLSAVSYLTLIPAIVLLAIAPYNRSSRVRFHAWQSIAVGVIVFLVNFILSFLMQSMALRGTSLLLVLEAVVGVAYTLVVIWCSVRALNGSMFKLPLIGAWAERQANK